MAGHLISKQASKTSSFRVSRKFWILRAEGQVEPPSHWRDRFTRSTEDDRAADWREHSPTPGTCDRLR